MDDYIKRSDAIKTVCGDCEYYSTNDCEDCRLDRLTKIPPAEVRPVVGVRWKHDKDGLIWCPNCGFGKERSDERAYHFCPNCGAKMGGTP